MQDLRLVGIHEDGVSLLLAGPDGDRLRLPVDDALRAAIRRDRPRGDGSVEGSAPEPMRPREVQALMRAGATTDEVAERSGWTVEKVRRFEPPIRAERDYVAGLAREVALPGRPADGQATLGDRVQQRLKERGVELERVAWDAWKDDDGRWSVVCIFPAGGRERRAAWTFVPDDRALTARDDEARWLGEDAAPTRPKPAVATGQRAAGVYDVESDGGVASVRRRADGTTSTRTGADDEDGPRATAQDGRDSDRRTSAGGGHPSRRHRPADRQSGGAQPSEPEAPTSADEAQETVDLVSAMRERVAARKRTPRKRATRPTDTPISPEDMPTQARPVERLRMADAPPPPATHGGSGDGADEAEFEEQDGADGLGHDPVTGTADLFSDLEAVAYGPEDDLGDDAAATPELEDADESVARVEAEADGEARDDDGDVTDQDDDDDHGDHDHGDGDHDDDDDDDVADDQDSGDGRAAADEGHPATASGAESKAPATTAVPSRQSASRKGRPSVPSWDDIMFGTRGPDQN